MTMNTKHERLIQMASRERGAPSGIYTTEAWELLAAGVLEQRETFSKVGARKIQLFLRAA